MKEDIQNKKVFDAAPEIVYSLFEDLKEKNIEKDDYVNFLTASIKNIDDNNNCSKENTEGLDEFLKNQLITYKRKNYEKS